MQWDVFLVMNGPTNHDVSLLLTDLMYMQAILKEIFIHVTELLLLNKCLAYL